jgi:TonB-dependent SusC/RagA subfamily outer membrane receptor
MFISVQIFGQTEPVERILKSYFHREGQQISIRKDTLWVIWHEPADKFNPLEFRDTSAIPLKQIQAIKFIKGRNSRGESGIGMQLIPWIVEEKSMQKAPNEVDNQTLKQVNTASVNQKLQGQVSGVTVGNDNSPGGGAMVRIRGIGSINANSPLYVVDGVALQGNINSINPNDISSVQVLKDPSQTAMYGVRGANGVIVITTLRNTENANKIPQNIMLPLTVWHWDIHRKSDMSKDQVKEVIEFLRNHK